MGGRKSGYDLALQPFGPKDHAVPPYRYAQIRDRKLLWVGRAGLSEKGDLVSAQDGPTQDVAQSSFGQMHDFGEHRVGTMRFLGARVLEDVALQ